MRARPSFARARNSALRPNLRAASTLPRASARSLAKCAIVVLALSITASLRAQPATPAAPPEAPAAPPVTSQNRYPREPDDLQHPEHRSTRYSAYSLPAKRWSADVGVLGISGDDVYGRVGLAYGFKHGFQLDANIGHWVAGLFGVRAKWSFFERKHVALAVNTGLTYAHGAWLWMLDDFGQEVVDDADMIAIPVAIAMSVPCTRWLQFDLTAQYQYTQVFGSIGTGGATFYADTQFGARQLLLLPTARLFLSASTAFEFLARLPVYNKVPYEADATLNVGQGYGRSKNGYASVDFSEGWTLEFGVRSRLRRWLFATTRLHVGQLSKNIYGALLYPSFNLEFRLP
jgi:hypothetical protein